MYLNFGLHDFEGINDRLMTGRMNVMGALETLLLFFFEQQLVGIIGVMEWRDDLRNIRGRNPWILFSTL